MKCTIEEITPEIAEDWLLKAAPTGNRSINSSHLCALADAMRNGHWKLNGDPIRFTGGTLMDGQHRLKAVVLTGTPIQSVVVRGVGAEAFDTIDQGKKRSASDVLRISGEVNTNNLAAAARWILLYEAGGASFRHRTLLSVGRARAITSQEIVRLIERCPDIRHSVSLTIRLAHAGTAKLMPPGLLGALHYIFSRKNAALADRFAEGMVTGFDPGAEKPFHLLRERLVTGVLSKVSRGMDFGYIGVLAIKAWNYMRTGQISVKALKFTEGEKGESVPQAV